jgi:hypothetical protein
MNSLTFLVAFGVVGVAAWSWVHQPSDLRSSFPVYGTIAASYAGGFLIGRVFRRIVTIAAIIAALVIGGLTLLNRTHLDTSKAKEAVGTGATWFQDQAHRVKGLLLHVLPSGGAAAVGAFAGGRRRR